ncbi:MAG: sigma-54-dependent Fis family transcriptional regulator [Myxococcota bacterium]
MDVLTLRGASATLWERFQEGRLTEEAPLVDRWERVRALGVPALGVTEIPIVSELALKERKDSHRELLLASAAVLEDAARSMSDQHYTLLLCDPSGLVLGRWGGGEFEPIAERARLIEGADWSEPARGTNAIGTALAEGRAVAVEGCAHYARDNHSLACYASVLYGPDGNVVGLIDATSFSQAASPFVSVAVSGIARAIEARLANEAGRRAEARRARVRAVSPRAQSNLPSAAAPFDALLGDDPQLLEAKTKAARFARSPLPLLLLAETGTGKELLARAVHQASARAAGPFVAVNCGALTAQLLETELFGYGPGAFTGAQAPGQRGKLEAASGGTLFLDEIAEMSPSLQAMLLRVLEDGVFYRVGEVEPRQVDLRIVCATCRDLEAMVEDGRFRSDLYFRICGATLSLPPLRARTDVLMLAEALLSKVAAEQGRDCPRLSPEVRAAFERHGWPGNVRELKSTLLHALVLADDEIRLEHLPASPPSARRRSSAPPPAPSLESAEKTALLAALAESSGNLTAAARRLGVARSTLYRMMERHGVAHP